MKITAIRAFGLRGATPAGGWRRELTPDDDVHTLVAVSTDEGLTGVGSAFTSEALVRAALSLLEPHLAGVDPREPVQVSERLHQHTFWQGRGGAVTHAISALDIALWDILGQSCGVPLYRLWGGRYRERVRPYASLLMSQPDDLHDRLTALVETGYTAFKIGWGPFGRVDAALDEKIVAAARDAVGPEALLAVDAGGSDAYWTPSWKWARRSADMLAGYGVAWFEEPLSPDDVDGLVRLTAATDIDISGGEVLTRRQGFREYLQRHAVDIVQPDVTKVGGITELRRIADAAADAGVGLIPHGWNTAVGLAADLQIVSTLPGTELVEYCAGAAYIDEIVTTPWRLDADGRLPVPDAPGLGITLDPAALERFSAGGLLPS